MNAQELANIIIPVTLGHEGGAVDIKDDLGGKTNMGITQGLLDSIGNKYGVTSTDELTLGKAIEIYKGEFFDKVKAADIYNAVVLHGGGQKEAIWLAAFVFDSAVNHGVGNAGKMLQSVLNVSNRKAALYPDIAEDGAIGNQTIKTLGTAIQKLGDDMICWTAVAVRQAFYIRIIKAREANETFTAGWLANRMRYWTEKLVIKTDWRTP